MRVETACFVSPRTRDAGGWRGAAFCRRPVQCHSLLPLGISPRKRCPHRGQPHFGPRIPSKGLTPHPFSGLSLAQLGLEGQTPEFLAEPRASLLSSEIHPQRSPSHFGSLYSRRRGVHMHGAHSRTTHTCTCTHTDARPLTLSQHAPIYRYKFALRRVLRALQYSPLTSTHEHVGTGTSANAPDIQHTHTHSRSHHTPTILFPGTMQTFPGKALYPSMCKEGRRKLASRWWAGAGEEEHVAGTEMDFTPSSP